jgi:hypothetical protein
MTPFIVLYLAIGFLLAAHAINLLDGLPTWAKVTAFFFDLLFWPLHLLVSLIIILVLRK